MLLSIQNITSCLSKAPLIFLVPKAKFKCKIVTYFFLNYDFSETFSEHFQEKETVSVITFTLCFSVKVCMCKNRLL